MHFDFFNFFGTGEILLRLASAAIIGAALGINRDLSGKPAGLRTHALVTLGSAFLAMMGLSLELNGPVNSGAMSRVVQGICAGIGFLGGGVILRDETRRNVHGLTTAASIWVASSLGIACGAGFWWGALIALCFTLLVLIFGGPIEAAIHRRLKPHSFRERARRHGSAGRPGE